MNRLLLSFFNADYLQMVQLGKRRRTIVVSDDEDVAEIAPSTPEEVTTPTKPLPSKPSKDAKFWVESISSFTSY
jgi:hypothetical protein